MLSTENGIVKINDLENVFRDLANKKARKPFSERLVSRNFVCICYTC